MSLLRGTSTLSSRTEHQKLTVAPLDIYQLGNIMMLHGKCMRWHLTIGKREGVLCETNSDQQVQRFLKRKAELRVK